MNIYIDESIHDKYGFILIAYVLCGKDPKHELQKILSHHGLPEFHASEKMRNNKAMQEVRRDFLSYINQNCKWGVMVLSSSNRFSILPDFLSLLSQIQKNGLVESSDLYFDEGIITIQDLPEIERIEFVHSAKICNSVIIHGIQLADLVAALCGVRLREEISQNPKFLQYGAESGYDPPIEAEVGYELWASLRYSMLHGPAAFGEDMPSMAMYPTYGYGFFLSTDCSDNLREKADKTFGAIYLGCIH
jgi:hypothetical protein